MDLAHTQISALRNHLQCTGGRWYVVTAASSGASDIHEVCPAAVPTLSHVASKCPCSYSDHGRSGLKSHTQHNPAAGVQAYQAQKQPILWKQCWTHHWQLSWVPALPAAASALCPSCSPLGKGTFDSYRQQLTAARQVRRMFAACLSSLPHCLSSTLSSNRLMFEHLNIHQLLGLFLILLLLLLMYSWHTAVACHSPCVCAGVPPGPTRPSEGCATLLPCSSRGNCRW
jgi:hypothetical protein